MKTLPLTTASAWAQAESARTITLEVEGMHRMVDMAAVTAVLTEHAGVSDVQVDLERHLAVATVDSNVATGDMLARALTGAGYPARVRR
jgi:copper chaperone CopZ